MKAGYLIAGLMIVSQVAFAAYSGGRGKQIRTTGTGDAVDEQICSIHSDSHFKFRALSAAKAEKLGIEEKEWKSFNRHLQAVNSLAGQEVAAKLINHDIQLDPSLFWKTCAGDLIDRATLNVILKLENHS